MNLLKNHNIFPVAIVLAIAVNAFSWHLPFFWDTILTSTITQYFYTHGFQGLISPAEFDAGHPPLFYIYVTGFYHLLGKNLFAAHLSMLPFTILGIISFIRLLKFFCFTKPQQWTGLFLYFAIPAVITQNAMVSYDAVLLSLYLAALVAYFKNNKLLFVLILIGITGITLRGLFCLVSLSVTIFFLEKANLKSWFKWNLLFIPAIIIIGSWYCYHYSETGWLFSTKAEGWSGQRGFADLRGIFKNGFSIARCFFDLGLVILSFLSLFYLMQKRKMDDHTLLWLVPSMVFSVLFFPFTNPVNHRYYLIAYVLMLLPVIRFLSERKKIYTNLTAGILLLGHFQIYPAPISNGWDCTLVHLSYLREKNTMATFYDDFKRFGKENIGTVFPMNASLHQTEMTGDTIRMFNVNGKSIDSLPYILYSNVGNDFSDEQIAQLKEWNPDTVIMGICTEMILYANPEFIPK